MKRLIPFLTIFLFFSFFSSASAQDFGLSISPPLLQVSIKPGKSVTQVFNLQNNSFSSVTLIPQIIPFTSNNISGQPQLQPQLQPDWLSYFSLINTDITLNQPFTIPAGQKQQLVLNLSVPSSSPTHDHYATLLLTSPENQSTSLTGISASLGANLLLTVTSTADPHSISQIKELLPQSSLMFKIGSTFFLDNLTPVSFKATLKNQGSHLIETHGLFEIGHQNKTIHLQSLLPVYTLAYSQRQLLASPSGQLTFTPSLNHLGSYQANISLRAPNSSANSSITLVFLPIKAGLSLILLLIIITTLLKHTSTNPIQAKKRKSP